MGAKKLENIFALKERNNSKSPQFLPGVLPNRLTMPNYAEDFYKNRKLIDKVLRRINQRAVRYEFPKGLLNWFIFLFPVLFQLGTVVAFIYLVFIERPELEVATEQMWCGLSFVQIAVKSINGLVQKDRMIGLLEWCERVYTTKYKVHVQEIVDKIFGETNDRITLLIR